MAMLPFCGYNMADYFQHWLDMGRKMESPPKIFHVNWFRTDRQGRYLWPGFGENLRVLEWILDRARGGGEARETPIGFIPKPNAIDLTGLDLSREAMEELLSLDHEAWLSDLKLQEDFFSTFGARFPSEIKNQLQELRKRLSYALR